MADMDTAAMEAHIAVIKRATEAGREACEGDWRGKDFAQEQSAYDPSEVDHAIAAILNAVADGALVRADRIEELEAEVARLTAGLSVWIDKAERADAALTVERAGADALAEYVTHAPPYDSRLQSKREALIAAHDARRKGGV